MAVGTYNPVRDADISPNDVEMFYTFSSSRENNSNTVTRLEPTELLTELKLPSGEQISGNDNLLGGLYNLTLPSTTFNQLGIYTVYIRGKRYNLTISDCGVLSGLPNVKGVVINSNDLPSELTTNNALQGYSIEYLDTDGSKIRNTTRTVVTSNKVVPVSENIGNTSQKAVRYRFDESGSLIFLQVTPSSSSNVKPNSKPFIGNPNQDIILINNNVNPIAIEVEFVENDIDSIRDIIAGEQIRDVQRGILTHYDKEREIVDQFDLYEIDDDINSDTLYEVKQRKDVIDDSQDYNTIIDSVND
jgi:hypothetical protein